MPKNTEMTAKQAFDELNPVLDKVMKLMTAAPLSKSGLAALAVMVCSYFIGVLCATLGMPKEEAQSTIQSFLNQIGIPECPEGGHATKH